MAGARLHWVVERLLLKPAKKKEGRQTGRPQEETAHPRQR